MSQWAHGYNVSQGYTYGFYREMAPDWIDFCVSASGAVPPRRRDDGGFRYLELGCGQGFGLCLLAAANPAAEFVGIDFHAGHIAHANDLAATAELTNVRFSDGDFLELAEAWPADFGQFDYTAMHGIFSWIAPPVRRALVRCLAMAVPPGGVVYNSYNTQPGWVSTMPFQHMMKRLQAVTRKSDDEAVEASIALFDGIFANSRLGEALPQLKARVEAVKNTEQKAYLGQEYLNGYWQPFWFSEVVEELASAKLDYVSTATPIEQLWPGTLPPDAQALVAAQNDPTFAQEVIDCLTAKAFRRDILCRGARPAMSGGQDAVMDTAFHLAANNIPAELAIKTTLGDMKLPPEVFVPVAGALAETGMTLRELAGLPAFAGATRQDVIQAALMMLQAGLIAVAPRVAVDPEPARRFNAAIAQLVSHGASYRYVATPALASGAQASEIDCMLIDSFLASPEPDHVSVAEGLYQRLHGLGRSLMQDGVPLEGDAAAQRIVDLAAIFLNNDLPRWRRLGVIA